MSSGFVPTDRRRRCRPAGPNTRFEAGLGSVWIWHGGPTFAGGVDVPAYDGDMGAAFDAGVAVGRVLGGRAAAQRGGVATGAT